MTTPTKTDRSIECKQLLLSEKQCVCFLGAGMSKPPGDDWKGLVQKIAQSAGLEFNPDGQPDDYLLTLIDDCIAKNIAACNDSLRESIPAAPLVLRSAGNYLLKFKLKAIFTTNFDPWLKDQPKFGDFKNGYCYYPDLHQHNGIVDRFYFLHGLFDADDPDSTIENLVLGKNSFDIAYSDASLLPGLLLNAFVYENLVFVGINPLEPHLSNLLEKSLEIRRRIGPNADVKRFIFTPEPTAVNPEEKEIERQQLTRFDALGLEPVFYDGSLPDYRGIDVLLRSWAKDSPGAFLERQTGFN